MWLHLKPPKGGAPSDAGVDSPATPKSSRCLVCGGREARTRYRITRFRVLECVACDQIYLDPLPSEQAIGPRSSFS